MVTILADGIAYGALLFLLALGLSVTMGVMNVVNLAHGVFAMAGGYVAALAMERWGVPFLATLPLAFLGAALLGAVLERVLYTRLYARSHLDQVLATVGLVFVASTVADVALGAQTRQITLPDWLRGRVDVPAAASAPTGSSSRRVRRPRRASALRPGAHALRRAAARGGG